MADPHQWDRIYGETIEDYPDLKCPTRVALENGRYLMIEFGPPIDERFNISCVPAERRKWFAEVMSSCIMRVHNNAVAQTQSKARDAIDNLMDAVGHRRLKT